ncbi:MAG: hypothetical protein FVQ83_17030 [Chloroflexi bacterium]|nr:hypothetical protein [Chloroflexota bacterium]
MTQDFSWCCRSTDDPTVREAYLLEAGWTANIGYLGPPDESEYQIAVQDGSVTLALFFVELLDEWNPLYWPPNREDDCYGVAMVYESLLDILDFSTERWVTFIAADG